jgi:aminocarboxymuconate-semialdehyde decarboxylase
VSEKLFKVDIHTHILPKTIPNFKQQFGYGGFVSLEHHKPNCANMMLDTGKFFREIESNTWDPTTRIKESNDAGVNVQVLSTVPVMFSYWAKPDDCLIISQFLNDHIASVVEQYPDRFIGLATLPLQAPEMAAEELDRCVKDLGLKGFEMGTHINKWNLENIELLPVYKAAEQLNTSIFVHPWDMPWREAKYWAGWLVGMPAETSLAICSLLFGGIFAQFPTLRFAFAHGGGSFPGTIGRIEHGYNVRPDLCAVDNQINPRQYLGKFWIDSLVHDKDMLLYLIDLIGADKIALGSDYPFPLGELTPGKLIESIGSIDDSIKQDLLANAALSWLNMDIRKFQ